MNLANIFNNVKNKITAAYTRFPVSFLILLLSSIFFSIQIERENFENPQLIFASGIALLLSFLAYIFSEANEWSKLKGHLGGLLAIVIGAAIYFILPENITHQKYYWVAILLSCVYLILVLMISCVPFYKSAEGFKQFNSTLFFKILEALFLAILIFLALSLLNVALENLFQIIMKINTYAHLGVWSFIFIGLSRLVSEFPSIPFRNSTFELGKPSTFITTYFGIPVSIIYGIVAYIYISKSLLNNSDTISWINPFILWFVAVGYLTYLLNKNLLNSRSINTFYNKYWLWFVLPIGIFYCINLIVNLGRDGLDEEYYFLMLAGVLLVVSTIYLLIKNDLRIINYTAIFLLIFAILPTPWNAWNSTTNIQKSRLIKFLTEKEIIKEGTFSTLLKEYKIDKNTRQLILALSYKDELQFLKTYDPQNVLPDSISSDFLFENLQLEAFKSDPNENHISKINPKKAVQVEDYEFILPLFKEYETKVGKQYLLQEGTNLYYVNEDERWQFPITKTDIQQETLIRKMGDFEVKLVIEEINATIDNQKANISFLVGYGLSKKTK